MVGTGGAKGWPSAAPAMRASRKPLRQLSVEGSHVAFHLHAEAGVANALRRSLMSDVRNVAPHELRVLRNTSCQTDEYIAHRIGMIPFAPYASGGGGGPLKLHVCGRTATSDDLVGGYRANATHTIQKMVPGQELHIEVYMREDCGGTHARWSNVAGIGYEECDGHMRMRFEVTNGRCPFSVLREGIVRLRERAERVRGLIAADMEALTCSA